MSEPRDTFETAFIEENENLAVNISNGYKSYRKFHVIRNLNLNVPVSTM